MNANLPQPAGRRPMVPSPGLLRAAVSPGALALTAAGAAVGALVFHVWVVALVLALAGWGGGTAAGALAAHRRRQAARPRPAPIDPWSVPEPWRGLLAQAAGAQSRFDRVVADWPPGPLRERLMGMQPQVWADVAELAAMARRGAALGGWDGPVRPSGVPSAEDLSGELRAIAAERSRPGAGSPGPAAELDRREEAAAAQLRARRSSEESAADLAARMRSALALLEQSVTGLLALGGETTGSQEAMASLDRLSLEVTALREAVAETSGTPPEPTTP